MVSLQPLHTFGTSNFCETVINIYSEQDVFDFLSKDDEKPYMILGGGSNVLFTKNFDGSILLNKIKGIELMKMMMLFWSKWELVSNGINLYCGA
jgi:UDP-N-acetylmuramate dehydrogenase